jgi:hypothetical protein
MAKSPAGVKEMKFVFSAVCPPKKHFSACKRA